MKKSRNLVIYLVFVVVVSFVFADNVFADCPLGARVTKDLSGVLKIFKIIAPCLVVGYSIYEAIMALTKGDVAADMKKVAKRFAKRLVYAVILFFLPVLVDIIMQMADVWDANGGCDFEVDTSEIELSAEESKHCSYFDENKCSMNTDICSWDANDKVCRRREDVTVDEEREALTVDCGYYVSRSECNRENSHNNQCSWDTSTDTCINISLDTVSGS